MPETTVFLSLCSEGESPLRDELANVLQRAGIKILPSPGTSVVPNNAEITQLLSSATCSVHIIFPHYSIMPNDPTRSLSAFQFEEGKKILQLNPAFKMFVWLPPSTTAQQIDPQQTAFINEVRNNISRNMVFSNAASPLQLVDDIRSAMERTEEKILDLNQTDIFLVSNQLDENEANEIIDMLSDIVPVERLNIIQDSDTDYSELCKQQIAKSKLAVIYFKESGDWALPFAQQVWKKIGGATSHTPILLIGDDDPETNLNKKFKAPKVISMIIAGQLIPLEIKVQFDKVVEIT